eukprot:2377797-Prymnesium_polylepis.1
MRPLTTVRVSTLPLTAVCASCLACAQAWSSRRWAGTARSSAGRRASATATSSTRSRWATLHARSTQSDTRPLRAAVRVASVVCVSNRAKVKADACSVSVWLC